MKTLKLALVAATLAACSSNARMPETVYEARDRVNETGTNVRAKVRPAVRPLTESIDRRVASGADSVGLHVGATKN